MSKRRVCSIVVALGAWFGLSSIAAWGSSYQFLGFKGDAGYLVSLDGKSKLRLTIEGGDMQSMSPSGRGVVSVSEGSDKRRGRAYWLDFLSLKSKRIGTEVYSVTPDGSGDWLDDHTVVLGSVREAADDGEYAVNVDTGATGRIVPPSDLGEFNYDRILVSPDKKKIATCLGVTMASIVTMSDIRSGKRLWPKPGSDGVDGQTDLEWASDSKSLLATFYRNGDDPDFPGPGGLWRYDAASGMLRPWKYKGQNLWGVWTGPGIITIARTSSIEFLNNQSGASLFKVTVKPIGKDMAGGFLPGKRFFVYDKKGLRVIDLNAKKVTFSLNGKFDTVEPAPSDPNKLLCNDSRIIDLRTGTATPIAGKWDDLQWLPREILK